MAAPFSLVHGLVWLARKRVNTTFHRQQEKGQKANVWERGKWVESALE